MSPNKLSQKSSFYCGEFLDTARKGFQGLHMKAFLLVENGSNNR